MADQWFGDLAEVTIDGHAITIGNAITIADAWKRVTAAATWANNEIDKPVSKKVTITIPCMDVDDHAEYLILWNIAEAKLPVAAVIYPQGNTAGKLRWSGNVYVSISGIESGIEKAAGFTLTLDCSGDLVPSPNLKLATQALGSVAQSAAGSGYTSLSASGGTATYTYTLVTQLPAGVTMNSSGVFGGTVNAACADGTHTTTIRVTDSASTPVVKDFVCTFIVS